MGWGELGQAVTARRVELGHLTIASFAKVVELSTRILGDIEGARRSSYDPATLVRIERALEWPTGRVRDLLGDQAPGKSFSDSAAASRPRERRPQPDTEPEPVDLSAELMTFEGLVGNLHRLDPGILAALLHRSGVGPEGRWRAVQALRALAVEQLRANWQALAEVIVAEGGAVDVSTWPGWLEAPQMVEELKRDDTPSE